MASIIGVTHNESQAAGTTIGATRTIGAGRGVIIIITHDTSANTITGASSVSDGVTSLPASDAVFNSAVIGQLARAFAFLNHTGGSFTFTVTFPASVVARAIYIIEVDSMALSAAFDTSTGAEATSAVPSAGPITPAQDGAVVIAYSVDSTAPALAGGTTFTDLVTDSTVIFAELAGQIQPAKLAVTAGWTLGSANGWMALIVAYKPGLATPLGSPRRRLAMQQRAA